MPPLIKERAVVNDEWTYADAPEAATATKLVLPLADYLVAAAAGQIGPHRGVSLKAEDQDLEPLRPWIAQLPLVTVDFKTTGDGRGYTQGKLLRERYGYTGEMRARGMVRADMMWFLVRCGFDAYDLAPGEEVDIAIAQLHRFSVAYQAGAEGALAHPRMRYGR